MEERTIVTLVGRVPLDDIGVGIIADDTYAVLVAADIVHGIPPHGVDGLVAVGCGDAVHPGDVGAVEELVGLGLAARLAGGLGGEYHEDVGCGVAKKTHGHGDLGKEGENLHRDEMFRGVLLGQGETWCCLIGREGLAVANKSQV